MDVTSDTLSNETYSTFLPFSLLNESVSESFLNGSDVNSFVNQQLQLRNLNLKPILSVVMPLNLVLIMLAMGCDITWESLLGHLKRPIGLCIGMLSQFVVVPLSAFCMLLVFGITGIQATGVMLVSCCPGGVVSNMFSYFCYGDVPLSVAMTTVSTIFALFMMPANIWVYCQHFESMDMKIPYKNMAVSLVIITSPVVGGMLTRWKLPKIAHYITKIGMYCGLFFIFGCIILEILIFPDMFSRISLSLYAVILSLPLVGATLSYTLAALLRTTPAVRRTIAIECGVQNVPIALTIMLLSFPFEMQKEIILLPWLYGIVTWVAFAIAKVSFQVHSRVTQTHTQVSTTEPEQKLGITEKEIRLFASGKDEVQLIIIPANLIKSEDDLN